MIPAGGESDRISILSDAIAAARKDHMSTQTSVALNGQGNEEVVRILARSR